MNSKNLSLLSFIVVVISFSTHSNAMTASALDKLTEKKATTSPKDVMGMPQIQNSVTSPVPQSRVAPGSDTAATTTSTTTTKSIETHKATAVTNVQSAHPELTIDNAALASTSDSAWVEPLHQTGTVTITQEAGKKKHIVAEANSFAQFNVDGTIVTIEGPADLEIDYNGGLNNPGNVLITAKSYTAIKVQTSGGCVPAGGGDSFCKSSPYAQLTTPFTDSTVTPPKQYTGVQMGGGTTAVRNESGKLVAGATGSVLPTPSISMESAGFTIAALAINPDTLFPDVDWYKAKTTNVVTVPTTVIPINLQPQGGTIPGANTAQINTTTSTTSGTPSVTIKVNYTN